jgi:hypothetical protein
MKQECARQVCTFGFQVFDKIDMRHRVGVTELDEDDDPDDSTSKEGLLSTI